MVLRSYGFFKSEGDWSRYVTIRDAMSGDPGVFLGSVDSFGELPSTVSAAKSLWGLGDYNPKVSDSCFVDVDSGHGGNPSQYVISEISGNNLSWKYQFSIPIPGGVSPDNITIDKNSSNELEVMDSGISTVKLVDSAVTSAKIADVNVTSAKLANNSVITTKIADSAVTAAKLANNSVITTKILPSTINNQILKTVGGSVVWSDGSSDVAVDNSSIDFNSSDELEVMDAGVTPVKIAPSSVDGQVLKTVSGDVEWANGSTDVTVDGVSIDFTVGDALEIKDLGVSTGKIADSAVITAKILDSNVTTEKIADSNVTTPKIADDAVTTVKVLDANITTPKIADDAVTTAKILDSNVTTAKIADDAVTTVKVLDDNITEPKLATNSVTTAKIVDAAVTPAKISAGTENYVLKSTGAGAVEWLPEDSMDNKADKFLYTPASGAETLYNLEDIQQFNVEGNGGGVDPNDGIVFTNFAGESVTIPIDGDVGFFTYKGQVDVYEDLPDFSTVENGDLYSIAGSITYKGVVDAMENLPDDPDPFDQYYVTAPGEYIYWYADAVLPDGGMWKTNHCQFEDGCNNTGWYAFGIGDTPSWNRLDGELSVDQTLNVDSANAIANRAVAQSLITKLNAFSPNTLSEFFNENDGGGLVFKDSSAHEVAGITLNTVNPQLYIHRYDTGGDLINRVLFEIHDDGAYISTVLTGTSWVRIATSNDIINLFQDYGIETEYNKNTIVRHPVVDGTAFNRYGFVTDDYESVDFSSDVSSGMIDELVVSKEFNDTLDYCIDQYFPSPVTVGG
jgi:hypothetical protein